MSKNKNSHDPGVTMFAFMIIRLQMYNKLDKFGLVFKLSKLSLSSSSYPSSIKTPCRIFNTECVWFCRTRRLKNAKTLQIMIPIISLDHRYLHTAVHHTNMHSYIPRERLYCTWKFSDTASSRLSTYIIWQFIHQLITGDNNIVAVPH